jgi:hypothetical protein
MMATPDLSFLAEAGPKQSATFFAVQSFGSLHCKIGAVTGECFLGGGTCAGTTGCYGFFKKTDQILYLTPGEKLVNAAMAKWDSFHKAQYNLIYKCFNNNKI